MAHAMKQCLLTTKDAHYSDNSINEEGEVYGFVTGRIRYDGRSFQRSEGMLLFDTMGSDKFFGLWFIAFMLL